MSFCESSPTPPLKTLNVHLYGTAVVGGKYNGAVAVEIIP